MAEESARRAEDLHAEKRQVAERFDRVARGYDSLNALNPGYSKHLRWSAARMALPENARILDLCCGTGLSTAALRAVYPAARITGLDASSGMLAVARAKRGRAAQTWLEGDAMDPARTGADGPFDGILMAYGLRNVTDADLCLARLRELLAKGGVLCLHEYSVADSPRSRAVWNPVAAAIIIPLGLAFTGTTSLFRYLRRSVLAFDGVAGLEERLHRGGFVDVRTEEMDGWQRGIVHSFLARRPA